MFSGQGSHYYQMGSELYMQDTHFRQVMQDLDNIAQGCLNISIVDLLYHQDKKKSDVFDQTKLTNAAIFMVEYALGTALITRGVKPAATLGVSLGIYAASCIAEALPPEDALNLVISQGELFDRCCPKGNMVAVLASPKIWNQHEILRHHTDLASINAQNHCVISVQSEQLPRILQFLQEQGLVFQTLAVSQAFHSRWIDSARDGWFDLFDSFSPKRPKLPLICSATQAPLAELTPESLWNIVRNPIHLQGSLQYLESRAPYRYIDVGPAGTLATLLKYSLSPDSKSTICNVMSPFAGEYKKYLQLVNETAMTSQ